MASGETPVYDFPYPLSTDPVNVAGDIQELAERIEFVLPTIVAPNYSIEVRNNSGSSIFEGDPVYITGYSTKPTVARSEADDLNTFPVIGLAETNIGNNSDGVVIISGVFEHIDTVSFSAGDILYVGVSGGLTNTPPSENLDGSVYGSPAVAVVLKSNLDGVVVVGTPKGNGTWGSLKAGLA